MQIKKLSQIMIVWKIKFCLGYVQLDEHKYLFLEQIRTIYLNYKYLNYWSVELKVYCEVFYNMIELGTFCYSVLIRKLRQQRVCKQY